MQFTSESEKKFIRTLIQNQLRLDSRSFSHPRTPSLINLNCLGFEKSYKIKNGLSDLDILISFEQNDVLLNHFNNLLPVISFPNLSINFDLKFDYSKYLQTFFTNTKLSVKIDVNVVYDDGNIIGLIVNFLNDFFSRIEVPSLTDFGKYEWQSYKMPDFYSFAVFGSKILYDPTGLEISSADGLVYVLVENKKLVEILFENGCVDLQILKEIKQKIEKFLLKNNK